MMGSTAWALAIELHRNGLQTPPRGTLPAPIKTARVRQRQLSQREPSDPAPGHAIMKKTLFALLSCARGSGGIFHRRAHECS